MTVEMSARRIYEEKINGRRHGTIKSIKCLSRVTSRVRLIEEIDYGTIYECQ